MLWWQLTSRFFIFGLDFSASVCSAYERNWVWLIAFAPPRIGHFYSIYWWQISFLIQRDFRQECWGQFHRTSTSLVALGFLTTKGNRRTSHHSSHTISFLPSDSCLRNKNLGNWVFIKMWTTRLLQKHVQISFFLIPGGGDAQNLSFCRLNLDHFGHFCRKAMICLEIGPLRSLFLLWFYWTDCKLPCIKFTSIFLFFFKYLKKTVMLGSRFSGHVFSKMKSDWSWDYSHFLSRYLLDYF